MNILVIAHGTIAESAVQSLEMIVGKSHHLFAINLQPEDTPEALEEKIEEFLSRFGAEQLLFMLDFMGGTPFQVCSKYISRPNTRCICGFNLSMLIHAVTSHDANDMDEIVEAILKVGRENICVFPPVHNQPFDPNHQN